MTNDILKKLNFEFQGYNHLVEALKDKDISSHFGIYEVVTGVYQAHTEHGNITMVLKNGMTNCNGADMVLRGDENAVNALEETIDKIIKDSKATIQNG